MSFDQFAKVGASCKEERHHNDGQSVIDEVRLLRMTTGKPEEYASKYHVSRPEDAQAAAFDATYIKFKDGNKSYKQFNETPNALFPEGANYLSRETTETMKSLELSAQRGHVKNLDSYVTKSNAPADRQLVTASWNIGAEESKNASKALAKILPQFDVVPDCKK